MAPLINVSLLPNQFQACQVSNLNVNCTSTLSQFFLY